MSLLLFKTQPCYTNKEKHIIVVNPSSRRTHKIFVVHKYKIELFQNNVSLMVDIYQAVLAVAGLLSFSAPESKQLQTNSLKPCQRVLFILPRV